MLLVFLPIFVGDIKIISGYSFVAPYITCLCDCFDNNLNSAIKFVLMNACYLLNVQTFGATKK